MKAKRLLKTLAVGLLSCCMVMGNILTTQAAVNANALIENVVIVSEAAIEAYESSVIAQMVGRAGSGSSYGAKGIAFEVVYKDLKNLENFFCIFKPAEKIKLSINSIDEVADLIVTAKNGDVIGFIQCKDGTSQTQIRNVIQQVMKGKYSNASLVGTKECASKFNELAKAYGLDVKMIDSGVSTDLTQRIAEKALGGSLSTLAKTVGKCAAAGGVFSGAVSAIESVVKGETAAQTVGNVTVDALNGVISGAGASATAYLVTMGLVAFDAPAIVSVIGVFAATVCAGNAIMKGIDNVSDSWGLKDKIAQGYEDFLKGTADYIVEAEASINQFGKDFSANLKDATDNVGKSLKETGNKIGSTIASWF